VRQKLGEDSLVIFPPPVPHIRWREERGGGSYDGDDDEDAKQPIQKKSLLPKESSGALSESRIRTTVTARHVWL